MLLCQRETAAPSVVSTYIAQKYVHFMSGELLCVGTSTHSPAGGGVEIRPDAARLADLAQDWPEINHLYMVENFLRRLVPEEAKSHCELSLTLTDTGAIMMVLEAVKPQHSGACRAASMAVVETINQPSDDSSSDKVVKPLAKTGKLLGTIGNKMMGNVIEDQASSVTGDLNKMKNEGMANSVDKYNDGMKSLDEWSKGQSSSHGLLATLSTVLAATMMAVVLL